MEAAAGRGGSLPVPSSSQRKERRGVPERSFRSNGSGGPEHGKLGQSDERTIYEEETGQLEVDFCSIAIDGGGTSDDILQRRLHNISRQREELEQVEIQLRAQIFARAEITEVQKNFEAQIKEHVDAATNLKEQLHEREQCICTLEMKVDEKERELRAAKIDHEAVWAKEDLLREQNKELVNFRREREGLEAERAQHIKQIRDLQECIQEKEHRYLELEEQHRGAQETIMFKDEQLREAQAWMARAQEVDAFHMTTNQTLQAEIRERTEQFNQYFLGLQKQFAEVDRHHRQAIQQLQLELAEAKEQSGAHGDDSRFRQAGSKDLSPFLQKNENQSGNDGSSNGEAAVSLLSTKTQQVPGVALVPSSILGMGTFIPPGPVISPHPFIAHPQAAPPPSAPSPSSHLSQNHVGYFQPVPATASYQHWQSQQAAPEVLKSDGQFPYENATEGKAIHSDILETLKSPRKNTETVVNGLNVKGRATDAEGPQETIHKASSLLVAQVSDMPESSSNSKHKLNTETTLPSASEEKSRAGAVLTGERPVNLLNVLSQESKAAQPNLLDERALLACLARAIPAESGCGISISSTLHNRLRKILAPLQWNDYAREYGRLEEFVARHPELFVITGDFIHLCEGAKEVISASTAVAKVAAAAAAAASFAPYSSGLTSVAVTPVAQNHRQRKDLPAEPETSRIGPMVNGQRQNGVNAACISPPQGKGSNYGRRAAGGKQQGRASGAGMIPRR